MKKELLISVKDIADALCLNRYTLYRWINWWYSDLPKPDELYLPEFVRQGKSKLYKESDIELFRKFYQNLPRGAMADFNNYYFNTSKKSKEVGIKIKQSFVRQKGLTNTQE